MWVSKISGFGWNVKDYHDIWCLYIYKTSVSLVLKFLTSIIISAKTVIEKWTFQDFIQ